MSRENDFTHVNIKISNALIDEIDEYMAYMQADIEKRHPNQTVNRSDAIRAMVSIAYRVWKSKGQD